MKKMNNVIDPGPKRKRKPRAPAKRPSGAQPGVPRPYRAPAHPTKWRRARLSLGITQPEMARRLGVSLSRIRDFESGRDKPRLAYEMALKSLFTV